LISFVVDIGELDIVQVRMNQYKILLLLNLLLHVHILLDISFKKVYERVCKTNRWPLLASNRHLLKMISKMCFISSIQTSISKANFFF